MSGAPQWSPICDADKASITIDNPVIGIDTSTRGGDRVAKVWWQPEFDAWISGCRQMTMAPGYLVDGKSSKLHSPDIETPTHFIALPPLPEDIG